MKADSAEKRADMEKSVRMQEYFSCKKQEKEKDKRARYVRYYNY